MRAALLFTLALVACGSSSSRHIDDDTSPTTPPTSLGPVDGTQTNPNDATCGGALVTLSRTPVYMLFIVDGSGSMEGPKWQAAKGALHAFFDQAAAQNDYSFAAGMFLFDGTKGVPEFQQSDIPIHYVDQTQRSALENRIDGATPQGGTPLKLAFEGQIPFLESFVASQPLKSNGKRVLVVMTDGVPDGGADVQPQIQASCVALIEDAKKKDVTTFAVGIGNPTDPVTTYDPAFMGKLAAAGGTSSFQITPGQKTAAQIQAEMFDAINAIRGATQGCQFTLEATDAIDPKKVNVIWTDATGNVVTVPQDAAEGWTYDDPENPKTVILHGAICKDVQSESDGIVKIELGCATKVR